MRGKNEVSVGIAVVLGIIVAIAGALWLRGGPFGTEQLVIRARFTEVGQLNKGNPVKFRGVEVGQVTKIEFGSSGTGVIVTMLVRPDAEFPADRAVLLSSASMFGDWQAEIVSPASFPDTPFTPGIPGE